MNEALPFRLDRMIESFTAREKIERSSRWILGIVVALLMLGLIMVYNALTVKIGRLGGDPLRPLFMHAIKVGLGIAAMLAMMRFDYRRLGRHYVKIWFGTVVALVGVLLIGAELNGARRWFIFMGMTVQPSEFAKPALIIVVSSLMIRAGEDIRTFNRGLLLPLAASSVVCFLILVEPDFGTSVIAGCLAVTLLVIGGVRIKHFFLIILVMAPLIFGFAFGSFDHVVERLREFLHRSEGGQVDFSLMALGSGGILGCGLGGSQFKLNFIPECESDFIFSIIGEELGFIGTTGVILLFGGLIFHGIRILLGIRNRFGFFLATGVLLLITTQALVNIAVVVGMAPTKGLPLPFISSGGSSIVALLMAVGLLLNIARTPDLASEKVRDAFSENLFFSVFSPYQNRSSGRKR
jgi:cell division protein FtsW